MALVKIREEELDASCSSKVNNSEDDDDEDNVANSTPKLTRAKARALNKNPFPFIPTGNGLNAPPELVSLIQGELRSDDEDEEYRPGDEELHVSVFVCHFVSLEQQI